MKLAHHAGSPLGAASVTLLVAVFSIGLLLPLGVAQAATAVPLGTAESFAVLAGSTITNTGQSTITGDVGLDPGTSVTGFDDGADSVTHEGSQHIDDDVARQAKSDLDTAYTDAAGQTPVTEIPAQLGGAILMPGIYDSAEGTFDVTGTLTLDGDGDPGAVFIFRTESELKTASASRVVLIGDADPCNVYWQVGSSATLGTNSTFLGTIMADQSVTLGTGAVVEGRVLARVAAVTMDRNTITSAACAASTGDGADDTTGDDTTADGDTPADGDTTGQVEEVPSGPVATGGGGVAAATTSPWMQAAVMLVVVMIGGTLGIVARRRVRA